MILPDVNVLIYAFRKGAEQHALCQRWLRAVISSEAAFGISPLALAAVIRVTTDRRIFAEPSTIEEAVGFAEDLMSRQNCQIIEPGARHWQIFAELCARTSTTGRRVTDAWYAALAIEWGCEWITFDRDYARFPGLKWRTPDAAV
jgi:toxin-antitoxin system PIN domain toxin